MEKTIIYIEFAFLGLPVDRNATVNVHKIGNRLPNFTDISSKQENYVFSWKKSREGLARF